MSHFFEEAEGYVCFKVANHKASLSKALVKYKLSLPKKKFICVNTMAMQRLENIDTGRGMLVSHFNIKIEESEDRDLNEALISFEIYKRLLPYKKLPPKPIFYGNSKFKDDNIFNK
jgi:hypothetical protein